MTRIPIDDSPTSFVLRVESVGHLAWLHVDERRSDGWGIVTTRNQATVVDDAYQASDWKRRMELWYIFHRIAGCVVTVEVEPT